MQTNHAGGGYVMERSYIRIFNGNTLSEIIRIYDLTDARIFESVNDKYTFDFSCHQQPGLEYLTKDNIVVADGDYFRIYKKTTQRSNGTSVTVSCEHISYELNVKRDPIVKEYTGKVRQILDEMLIDNNTRFFSETIEIIGTHNFATTTGPLRSRIIEFAKFLGAEIKFLRFGISILMCRGHDYGLTLELGKNLIDLQETYEVLEDGTTSTSYEVDFIDLNKIVDANGQQLESVEAHLGDTVYLTGRQLNITQRIMSAGYNPFRKELPTIQLENPKRDITTTINDIGSGGGGTPIPIIGLVLQRIDIYANEYDSSRRLKLNGSDRELVQFNIFGNCRATKSGNIIVEFMTLYGEPLFIKPVHYSVSPGENTINFSFCEEIYYSNVIPFLQITDDEGAIEYISTFEVSIIGKNINFAIQNA